MSESYQPHGFVTASTTFPAAIAAWEAHLEEQGRSVYTIKSFRGDIQLLASYFSPDKTLGSVTTRDLNAFLNWLSNERNKPCSPKSYARRVTAIKSFFKWLTVFGVLDQDPAEQVIQLRAVSPLPEILTMEEQSLVMETAQGFMEGEKPDPRYLTLLHLLLSTGIKKGEALEISRNHIERDIPEDAWLYIRYANAENRYKDRKIELPAEWLETYDAYIAKYNPTDKIFPWSPRRLEYLLEDIGKAAGLTKHLSFAMCRWTCAVRDHAFGSAPETIRKKLGISKIQWREIYDKIRQLNDVYLGIESKEAADKSKQA